MTMPADGGGNSTDQRTATVNLDANVNQYVSGMSQAEQATNRTAGAVDKLDQKLQGISHRAAQKLIGFSERDFAVLGVAAADAATFEKQLGTLNATASITGQRMGGIRSSVESAFSKFPTSRTQVVQLAEAIDELGMTGTKSLGSLLSTFIKLGAASGEGPVELAQGLIQLNRLMGNTDAQQIGNYANAVLTVSKNAGVSVTGVLNFSQAIAPLARQAGIGEAAVLGISTAFTKAGADGYVAANTFNSMVSDITNLIQTGSPDLAKYANLIGVTVSQFKGMDKTTALERIFDTIASQGPKAINTLNQLGLDGVRAQSAVASVVQSGNLDQYVAMAQGASGNQNNLNKGSRAAMSNLADDLSKLRNQFTQFGTEIGATFLKPMELAVSAVTHLMQALNALVRPFAPIIAIATALAGVLSGLAGGAMGIAGLIGAGALVKTLYTSGPKRAFTDGRDAATARIGESEAERVARLGRNASAVQYAAWQEGTRKMPLRARAAYYAGQGVGAMREPIDPNAVVEEGGPSGLRQGVRGLVRTPFVATSAYLKSTRGFLADSRSTDYARKAYGPTEHAEAAAARAATGAATFSAGRTLSTASMGALDTAVQTTTVGFRQQVSAQLAANRASVASEGALKAVVRGALDVTKQFIQLGVETARTGLNLATLGRYGSISMAEGGTQDLTAGARFKAAGKGLKRAGGGVVGGVAGTVAGVGGAMGGMGPMGWAMLGLPIAMEGYSAFSSARSKNTDLTDSLNPLKQFDDSVGLATTSVANFSGVVKDAANAMGNKPTTMAQAAQLTPENIAAARTVDLTGKDAPKVNKGLAALGKYDKTNTDSQLAYLKSLGITDPQQLKAMQPAIVAALGQDQAQRLLTTFSATQNTGADYSQFGGAIGRSEANASGFGGFLFGSTSQSATGATLAGAAATGIQNQSQADAKTHDQTYANTRELQNIISLGGGAFTEAGKAGGDKGRRTINAMSEAVSTLLGGGKYDIDYNTQKRIQEGKESPEQLQQAVVDMLKSTPQGKSFLENVGTTDPSKINDFLKGDTGQSDYAKSMNSFDLGKFSQNDSAVQAAVGAQGNQAVQYQGMMSLYQGAGGGTKSVTDVTAALDKLKGTITDTNDPLYKLAQAASQYANQQAAYDISFKSRPAQFQQAGQQYVEAYQANQNNPTDDTPAALASAKGNYQQMVQAETSYEIQVQQQANQFGEQMRQSEEDYGRQRAVAKRDYLKQMEYSEQDYTKQVQRTTLQFTTQMQRQAQSAAQSIYSPFTRVESQYTTDAGTLVQNLQDQNRRIGQQFSQLQQLTKMGVSQQSIDTLDLSNPNNAQQTNELVSSLMNNPQLVQQINSAVGSRLTATTQLTQSTFSMTYRNTTADFNLQLAQGAQDFKQAEDRALAAQNQSMDDMAYNFSKMVERAGISLTMSMTNLYGTFADQYGNTLSAINSKIGKYAPALSAMLISEVQTMQAEMNSVGADTNGVSPTPPAGGGGGGGSFKKSIHAMGIISTTQHQATISEGNRPEMVLPLDSRGQQFMAGMYQAVSMSVLKTLTARGFGTPATGANASPAGQSFQVDQSTQFNGPITVQAQDPNEMQKKLEQQKRILALRRPPRSTAGVS